MSDRRSSSDLGASAEAALASFPFPERDWESDARAIEARLSESLRGSTDGALMAAPLPSESDEPSSTSATSTPLTNSGVRTQSLADLARRSVEKKQANERQMARESLAIAAQQRQVALANEPSAAASSLGQLANVSPARDHAPIASPASSRVTHHSAKIALAVPALALAAAALFWFKQPEPTPLATNPIGPAASSAIAGSLASTAAVAEQRAESAQDPAPRGVDPKTLPDEVTPATEPPPAKAAALPSKSGSSKSALKGSRAAAAAEASDQSLPPDPALRPADSRSGDLPAKPSTGAVQVALGSVMGGARHCVAGDDAPSSAVVVFGSDGRVQHVTVHGAAAGKSSASCIEAQLSRARVQPFAASSFSVNATVRPE